MCIEFLLVLFLDVMELCPVYLLLGIGLLNADICKSWQCNHNSSLLASFLQRLE